MKFLGKLSLVGLLGLSLSVPALAVDYYKHDSAKKKSKANELEEADGSASNDTLGGYLGIGVGSASLGEPNNTTVPTTSTATNIVFGAYYEHAFMPYLALRPELAYVQKGFNATVGTAPNTTTVNFAADYIEFPINVKGQLPTNSPFTPYVLTGPVLGFMTSSGETITTAAGATSNKTVGNTNGFGFAWDFGAGTRFSLSKDMSFDLGFRYEAALTDPINNEPPQTSTKLNVFQVLLGVGFAI